MSVPLPPRHVRRADTEERVTQKNRARGERVFLEKEDDPRPLHLEDACGHFIDYSRGPYKVLQQYA